MAVVGRDRELEAIDAFLDATATGGRVMVLDGAAGIGKTTLWREAVARAERHGVRVLRSSADRAETQLSFTALRDLLMDVFDEVSTDLPAPQRHAVAVALLHEEPRRPPDPGAIAVGVAAVLRALASRAPTLRANTALLTSQVAGASVAW